MRLLAFDKEYEAEKNNYLSVLENNLKDYDITLVRDLNDALALYKLNEFNIVLIDFTTKEGKEFLQEVNRLNTLQRIITMGYTLSCSSEMGCSYCIENFHKRRLIKPINSIDLYKTISGFNNISCKFAYAFENPKSLIKELIQRYNYFVYDEENTLIYAKNDDIQKLKQLLNLMVDLKSYNIEYQIIDDKSIKVL